MDKSDIIRVAYCSRLFLRSDREHQEVVGVSGPTFRKNLASGVDIDRYYALLDHECRRRTRSSLEKTVMDYVKASEAYVNVDWGARTDARARRRFCRMIFRLVATDGMDLTPDEEKKFRLADSDKELIELFYPGGFDERSAMNMAYVILFAFGITKPWEPTKERGYDLTDEMISDALKDLRELILQLKEDLPRMGSFEKPLVFDQWVAIIDNHLAHPELFGNCTPVGLMNALTDVANACLSVADPESAVKSAQSMIPIHLPGIWVDDADNGETRFWIFPYNMRYAFCYHEDMNAWVLTPYEFTGQDTDDTQFADSCYFVTPSGSMKMLRGEHKAENITQMAHAGYRLEISPEMEEPVKIEFYKRSLAMPGWFEWSEFRRLTPDDERYGRFREALSDMYDPNNAAYGIFRNQGAELTNIMNNLIGRDTETLYVWDYRLPERFFVTEVEPGSDYFVYDSSYISKRPSFSMRTMEISPEHPLYVIPLSPERTTEKKGDDKKKMSAEERQLWLQHFERVMKEADHISVVVILRLPASKTPILFFPEVAAAFPLDMKILTQAGVEKITSRQQFFT
ncbi:MAG: hypothetical protein K2G23_01270 [Muribaculaceae bacterium]|nr:hypothetical protein [Muribaculaceae bacterium]